MTRPLFIFISMTLLMAADAQSFRRPHPVTSVTKQFSAVWEINRAPRPIVSGTNAIPARVRVNAHSLILFAEESKKRLLRELGASDLWNGHVQMRIIDLPANSAPMITRRAIGNRWQYQIAVSEEVSSRVLLHTMVSVLLEEYAGRYHRTAPRIPAWLAEGFTEVLLQKNGVTLFTSLTLNRANFLFQPDFMKHTRPVLQTTAPVSYLNLSLPPAELQAAGGQARFRAHAHLFTAKLLAQPEGQRRMQFYLREINRRANSQHALLAAFDFKSMLAIEQWWSLTQTRFRNRDAFNRWTPTVAFNHLNDLLQIPSPDADRRQPVPLREYLETGTHTDHLEVLLPLVQKLKLVEINAPPQLTRVTRDYRTVLEQYIGKPRKPNGPIPTPGAEEHAARLKAAQEALLLLDTLLADLGRAPGQPASALGKILQPR